ncbi:hypothetical protein [Bradyrhizobium sp. SHOUNA76]|uniref:hypothetical protein n=1 Tax=Bradyrhizobium sp. SHOUNA76 TaxID=2908927 RepID=UPI001FF6B144|nr:hypothetical protein [Bradyrhizobium sp. SHOUNA76]MCJ9700180.1 hypothetical protein [Bradyrhizobium sp. SHOUNA76]
MPRLAPTQSTIKKLFAYTGNQCAMPNCTESLVDPSGTMLGKIAHIHAAEPGGARYLDSMTDEGRRAEANLFIICGKHHDIIDDKKNEADWSPDKLRAIKKAHEDRFKKAERQLIEQFVDATQINQPVYPKTLKAYGEGLDPEDVERELKEITDFLNSLKEVPLNERQFAIRLAERMNRLNVDELDVHDTVAAFTIGPTKFKRLMGILEHHGMGHISERAGYNQYDVVLRDEWLKIYAYCKEQQIPPEDVFLDLNFGLLDESDGA